MQNLLYVSQSVADDLKESIGMNIERYRSGSFHDLEATGEWRYTLPVQANLAALSQLDPSGSPESEITNSMIVGQAFASLTPVLAREARLWTRLTHTDGLEFARKRWLKAGQSDLQVERSVSKHFFANGLTACRDDHAISRLWWNHYIAKGALPEDPERALRMILSRSDIRSSLVERPALGARMPVTRAIIRTLEINQGLRRNENLFREFMKRLNLYGAGLVLEMFDEEEMDFFLSSLVPK
ncbi:DUF6339 family protein [Lysobacter soyae]|uniref:Uncharacterized protein n=1 Tax=Lysobacter soyae TaxID=2764185 RepID=A0ABX8WSI4_9GAMM|nr:DUF6339 family protein [Lysobacter sp. CJ11]QYR53808.1 hypothetical protein H8L67_04845 [Lysobacter sp. CJ11]